VAVVAIHPLLLFAVAGRDACRPRTRRCGPGTENSRVTWPARPAGAGSGCCRPLMAERVSAPELRSYGLRNFPVAPVRPGDGRAQTTEELAVAQRVTDHQRASARRSAGSPCSACTCCSGVTPPGRADPARGGGDLRGGGAGGPAARCARSPSRSTGCTPPGSSSTSYVTVPHHRRRRLSPAPRRRPPPADVFRRPGEACGSWPVDGVSLHYPGRDRPAVRRPP